MTVKVDFGQLDTSSDGYSDTLLDGRFFSGIAFEYDESGRLRGLAGYESGKIHGPWRSWSTTGQILVEQFHRNGAGHGPWREWYPDGHLKVDAYREYGFFLRRKIWNEEGELVKESKLDPASLTFTQLQRRRAGRSEPIIDIDVDTMKFLERPPGWGQDGST